MKKVAVVVYSPASRTYLVDVPEDLTGKKLEDHLLDVSDATKWQHVEDWDEEADFDGVREPTAVFEVGPDPSSPCGYVLVEPPEDLLEKGSK